MAKFKFFGYAKEERVFHIYILIIDNLPSMANNHRSLWLLECPALKAKARSFAENCIFENSNYPIMDYFIQYSKYEHFLISLYEKHSKMNVFGFLKRALEKLPCRVCIEKNVIKKIPCNVGSKREEHSTLPQSSTVILFSSSSFYNLFFLFPSS